MSGPQGCDGAEVYTLAECVEAARQVLGGIDLDPVSCEARNRTVRAARYYVGGGDGLMRPWGGRVFLHLPEDGSGLRVRLFWRRACKLALDGGPGSVVLWVGGSLEQLQGLQSAKPDSRGRFWPSPLHWPRVILDRWILPGDEETAKGGQHPGRGSYVCLLGGDVEQRRRFRERFGGFGGYAPGKAFARTVRNLDAEILAAVRDHGPMSKSAAIRTVRVRASSGLAVIGRLVESGALVVRNRRIAVPDAGETRSAEGGHVG